MIQIDNHDNKSVNIMKLKKVKYGQINIFIIAICLIVSLNILFVYNLFGKGDDWRNAKNGASIYTNGYCDQPYVVVLDNGKWLCVFTTNKGHEGSDGQHIVSCISEDHGKTWSDVVRIEEPGKESASWAMPYLTDYGRVYVFYDYNGDKIHSLGDRKNIREDMLGWYCYKYSDDEGKTWSDRYRLDVRTTNVDLVNDWAGKVQIMWGIGKPVDVDTGMMFAFTKIGKYILDDSEGWFFRCDNINSEKDVSKLNWINLPLSEDGLKNEALGPINSEQNIFQMNNGSVYCMHRTVSGHPAESYSYDGGRSWTLPVPPRYSNGIKLKNPRACPRIWKCKNGKYLFWYHNNGGKDFRSRNPAWISGGIERDGRIIWSQPEILLYEEEPEIRMSYPDLIEQDGKYWVTETNKEDARCHAVPDGFFDIIWSQFGRKAIAQENLVAEWDHNDVQPNNVLTISKDKTCQYEKGFTFDFRIKLADINQGQILFRSQVADDKLITIQTAEFGSVEIVINDDGNIERWNSDPGLINAYGEHCVAVTVDNGPKIIQFVVDETVCNGRNFRQYGWSRYEADLQKISFNDIELGDPVSGQIRPKGLVTGLRLYNRPLMNTEIIGNHRYERKDSKRNE